MCVLWREDIDDVMGMSNPKDKQKLIFLFESFARFPNAIAKAT